MKNFAGGKMELSRNDVVIAKLKLALDSLKNGRLLQARHAIKQALDLLECDDPKAVDDAVLKVLQEG